MKVILHISLLTEVEKPEDLQKKYDSLLPTLQKDEKFTILKYDTQFLPAPKEEE